VLIVAYSVMCLILPLSGFSRNKAGSLYEYAALNRFRKISFNSFYLLLKSVFED